MTTTLAETAATLRVALRVALATQWAPLGLTEADTSQNLREVVESTVWPATATEADCTALITAFIAKVRAEADGKNVVVLSAPASDVIVMRDGLSVYATVLLGFLSPQPAKE